MAEAGDSATSTFAVPEWGGQNLSPNISPRLKVMTDFILPSDQTWRMKNYFKLLEEQKIKMKTKQ